VIEDPQALVAAFETWLHQRTPSELLTADELQELLAAARKDEALWERGRPRFDRVWSKVEERLRGEARPAGELLGPRLQTRLLELVERMDPDPDTVRTFLRSSAVEDTLGSVLYTGIREFIRRADLIGAIVNKLPVIGPIRRKVMKAFGEEFDQRLEGRIKEFLGSFSGLAVDKLIQYVLKEENQPKFRQARRGVAEHLLARPVNSFLPSADKSSAWRETAWTSLREAPPREAEWIGRLYEDFGSQPLGELAVELSPRATEALARVAQRFLDSDAGEPWRASG
jgi:hypothetical protein